MSEPAPETVARFDARADDYARFRPSYPAAAVDAILAGLGDPSRLDAVDVGAGTGISTRCLLERGARAIALEPNLEMRAQAQADGLDARSGFADATGLAAESIDLVTAFQAFHWFANETASREFARILRPGGRLALVWNLFERDDPFTDAFADLLGRFGDARRIAGLGFDVASMRTAVRAGGFPELRAASFRFALAADSDELLGRLRSSSSTPQSGPAYDRMAAELQALVERFAVHGGVALVHRTEVYLTERPR